MEIDLSVGGVQVRHDSAITFSLDVYFHERRIWSFTVNGTNNTDGWHPWPNQLAERLYGSSEVSVRDSETEEQYASSRLRFDNTPQTFRLEDSMGRPLMVNKWLRLAPMLADGDSTDKRDELVEILATTRDTLTELGYQPFAVGGTVLGPYRDGDLLAHDDDGDLAVFFETEDPVDVSRGILKLQQELRDCGYRVRPHSHAHLQVYPPLDDVDPSLYVDIFAAFFKGGMINQPFHVRGPFTREQLLPFGKVEVRGEEFPVPADTEAWLEMNYDEHWRTPQPGFQFQTPTGTIRRFRNWFGSYNLHRHFWEAHASDGAAAEDYKRLIPFGKVIKFTSESIVNLGCGINPLLPPSFEKSNPQATVYGLDYADSVRNLASQVVETPTGGKIRILDVNFANYQAVLEFVANLPAAPFDIYAGFVLEGQDKLRRNNAFWQFARMALLSGGQVVIDHLDTLGPEYSYHDPRTWHLEPERIREEAAVHGLASEHRQRGDIMVDEYRRSFTRTVLTLADADLNKKTGQIDEFGA